MRKFFEGFFNIAKWAFFNICLYLGRNWSNLHGNFITNIDLDKNFLNKCRNSSGSGLWIFDFGHATLFRTSLLIDFDRVLNISNHVITFDPDLNFG